MLLHILICSNDRKMIPDIATSLIRHFISFLFLSLSHLFILAKNWNKFLIKIFQWLEVIWHTVKEAVYRNKLYRMKSLDTNDEFMRGTWAKTEETKQNRLNVVMLCSFAYFQQLYSQFTFILNLHLHIESLPTTPSCILPYIVNWKKERSLDVTLNNES